jgi:hypothetical protein
VFWLFLSQVLSADRACRETLRKFQAWLALSEGAVSGRTAGYCRARQRLRQEDIDQTHERLCRKIRREHAPRGTWFGRSVKVVDGSGLSMPDTAENQRLYPQAKGAKPGCGFPVMRVVALFCLGTGVLMGLAKGSLAIHERTLFRSLWDLLESGDVLLADRGFCAFADCYCLLERGVDCVMRNHQRRTVGKSVLRRLGHKDWLIEWHKGKAGSRCPDKARWDTFPDRLTLREIEFVVDIPGFRTQSLTIVTTLLDAERFPASAFAELYRRRWSAELFLRDIKTTLGMDILRCKTPKMIHKELALYLIGYNLVRLLMLEAAHEAQTSVERLSFKGSLATLRQWAPLLAGSPDPATRESLLRHLLRCLAADPLPRRPNRVEPRARKRRPKNYQLLNIPRSLFKEIHHRNKYTKLLS